MKFLFVGLFALAVIVLIAVRLLRGRIPVEPMAASGGPPAPVVASASADPGPRKAADIAALSVKLDIDEKPSLYILLSADGSITRMGTGTVKNTERELFIGRTDPAIFEAVRSHLSEAMLQNLGQAFQQQNSHGAPCKLTLNFQFKDGTSSGLAFLYSSESEGAPTDVADFVTAAVHETDPWYENFKRTAAGRQKP
jgi:hypothetical protein